MPRPALATLVASTILAAGAATLGRAQTADIHGTWTAELHAGKVFLQLRTAPPPDWNRSGDWRGDWSMGQSLSVDELSGLPANDEQLTAATIRFELRREAGTLAFDGGFRDGRGAGLFGFTPRTQYTDEMRRLGFAEDWPLWRRYQFAVQDVGPRYISALKAEGFGNLTFDEIARSRNHGVTLEYIKAMKAEGYQGATLADFVRTKDHGVTTAYIHDIRTAGFAGATIEDLVRAKDHGVSADYVADMIEIVKNPTLEQVIRMRDHGVTPGFVNHARARGFTTTDPDELIRLKNRGLR